MQKFVFGHLNMFSFLGIIKLAEETKQSKFKTSPTVFILICKWRKIWQNPSGILARHGMAWRTLTFLVDRRQFHKINDI